MRQNNGGSWPRTRVVHGGWLVGLTAVAAMGLASCGGDGESSTSVTTTVAAGSTSSSASGAGTTVKAGAGGGDFCAAIKSELVESGQMLSKAFSAVDPADRAMQMKAYAKFIEDANAKLLATAPAELRGDVEAFVRGSNKGVETYKTGEPPSTEPTPEFDAASRKIADYGVAKCGLPKLPTP